MNRSRLYRSLAVAMALFGAISLIYGFAKIAMAEEPRRLPVEISVPNAVALTATDSRARDFGYQACGLGAICIFIAATVYSLNMGQSRPKQDRNDRGVSG
jgi:hypothetical protein